MTVIGVTGPRELTPNQAEQVAFELGELLVSVPGGGFHAGQLAVNAEVQTWHVGDATGTDAIAKRMAEAAAAWVEMHYKNPDLPYRAQGAQRSTRLAKALAAAGGTLHAWPNKPAPAALKPSKSWPKHADGSGTWGTISLAHGLGVPVVIHQLGEFDLPKWLTQEQAVLL